MKTPHHWGQRLCSLVLCLLVLCAALPAQAAPEAAPLQVKSAARSGMVRVYLSSLGSPTALDVTVAGSYTTSGNASMTLASGASVRVSFNAATGMISFTQGGVTVDMGQEAAFRRHATSGTSGLRIAQARKPANLYPGDLFLTAQKTSSGYKLYAIVHVYIEYYLCGVVPYEMGDGAQAEALKAQAVAARTYTLNKMNLRAASLYDVVDTTNDQVYYGNSDSTAACTAAVNATKGIVLMNGSALTATYYTASNGGQTESAANLWGSSGYSYLTVKDDPYDLLNTASTVKTAAVYADWNASGQKSALKTLLNGKAATALSQKGYSAGTISRITSVTPHTPKYASPSRLYTKVDFGLTCVTSSGTVNITVTCAIFTDLEKALGLSINGSDNELWTVEKTSSGWTLSARRFGHGIGMSQRGAMRMGALGYSYAQILGFYYEGCTRVQYTFTHTILSAVESGGQETLTTTEEPAAIEGDSGCMATVKLVASGAYLAIRQSADAGGTILTSLPNGSVVTVLSKGENWTLVRCGSIVGFVQTSALTITGIPPTASNAQVTSVIGYATVKCTGTLNLRASASSSASVLTTIPSGAVLPVFEQSGSYAHVQYGAYAGWALSDFLVFSAVYPAQVADPDGTQATITAQSGSTVNLRQSASTSAKVLAALPIGTAVTALKDDGSWCLVSAAGTVGYVMSTFLVFGTGSTQPTPTPAPTDAPTSGETEAVVQCLAETVPVLQSAQAGAAELVRVARGESILVQTRGSDWCLVRSGSVVGYLQTAYLYFPQNSTGSAPVTGYATVTTSSGSLNLRSQPTAGSTILRTIPRLARVGVLEQGATWSRVTYLDQAGYVMTVFLTFEGTLVPTPTPAPTAPPVASPTDLVTAAPTAAPEGSFAYALVTTPSGSLNLRQGPAQTAKVLTVIPQGTRVQVAYSGGSWCYIAAYNGYSGYVMSQYLTFEGIAATPSPTPAPTSAPSGSTVTAQVSTGGGRLNVRERADTQSRVLCTLSDGAQVAVTERGSIWCRVDLAGQAGYVMSKYLQFTQSGTGSTTATVWTVSGSLNLRQSASSSAGVLLRLPRLCVVEVLQSGATWCQVRYGSTVGYAMTAFLRFDPLAVETPSPAPTAAPTPAPTAGVPETATVLTPSGGLNLRESASGSAKVLGVIPRLATVTVSQRGSDWCQVQYGTLSGFVMTKFLQFGASATAAPTQAPSAAPTETAPPTQTETTMYVATGSGSLNLRETASADAKVLAAIPDNAQVTCRSYGPTWSSIVYGTQAGYVMSKYLSVIPQAVIAVATATPETTEAATPTPTAAPVSTSVITQAPAAPVYDETLESVTDTIAEVISDGALNLRSWCAADAPLLATLACGTRLTVLEKGSDWMHVRWEETEVEGYCMAKYVLLTELAP